MVSLSRKVESGEYTKNIKSAKISRMHLIKKTVATSLYFLLFIPCFAYAGPDDSENKTITVVIGIAVSIALVTAIILYRAAHVKKEVNVGIVDVQKISVNTSRVPDSIREKIKKVPLLSGASQASAEELSKIVEEETQRLLQDIKQEYSVKYQVVMQEKNKEVESVKKEFFQVKQQYDTVQQMYKQVDLEKRTTDAVVKSIAEGLVVVNQKGEVLLMNPSAEKILGIQKEKKIGRSILEDMRDELMVSLSHAAQLVGE